MHEGERAGDALVAEVGEVLGQLGRCEHALVDEGARRERRDREVWPGSFLDDAAGDVDLPLERVLMVP